MKTKKIKYMKRKIFNTLKHKLQWLVIASALLGVSQGVWGSNEVHGNFSGSWADTDISSMTASITMNAGTYQFGIRYGGTWYSKTNLIIARNKNVTDQDLETNNGNITLNADVSGTYTFKLKDNNGKPRLSVTFPSSGSVDYVLVGDAALNGIGWQNTNSNLIMSGTPKSITFSNVDALPSANNVNFRIVPYNTWETSIGWNQWDGDTSDLTNTKLTAKGSDNNIKIATTSTLNITITYNGSSIHVATEVPCTAPTESNFTVSGNTPTYDGTAKTATVASSNISTYEPASITAGYGSSSSSTTLNKTDAGTYNVYVTAAGADAKGTYCEVTSPITTSVGTLTIKKVEPTSSNKGTLFDITVPSSSAYTGTAKTATVSWKTAYQNCGAITIKYYNGSTLLDGAPVNVGSYTVKISVAAGTNNKASASEISVGTFSITKANQSTAVTISNSGTQCIPSAGGDVDISASGGNTSETITYAVVGDPDDGISLSGKRMQPGGNTGLHP